MKDPIISIKEMSLSIENKEVLSNITQYFYDKNLYVLIGPNGSGKTSLLKAIYGSLSYNKGNIEIIDNKTISFVPDSSYLYEYLTAEEYLSFIGKLNGMEGKVIKSRSEELLKSLYLYNSRNNLIKSYSNGMKQKLSIASSMIIKPHILLLDEPMTGTDYLSNKVIKDFLINYSKENLVIISTHFFELVYELSNEILPVVNGRIKDQISSSKVSERELKNKIERVFLNE
ncbi:ABC transporter ATP-binding protein [Staphylococcus pseudintermedius]|uniref:ABC transporter ATP-binding protein n=1 Tax=Staphylococcus pseudintermedius TaxID=283734 RepID=UPI002927CB02|nr:ABC transporter ATP-binding protein [Staphylococcus pseudintermedius]MDU9328972.1 ABC transporter ATP-binding protein [Staphylococcus pseudintermedius]